MTGEYTKYERIQSFGQGYFECKELTNLVVMKILFSFIHIKKIVIRIRDVQLDDIYSTRFIALNPILNTF